MSTQPKDLVYSLYILNKAGSLLLQRDFVQVPRLSDNDYIFLGSTFHSLHALSSRKVGPSGLVPTAVKPTSSSSMTTSTPEPLVAPNLVADAISSSSSSRSSSTSTSSLSTTSGQNQSIFSGASGTISSTSATSLSPLSSSASRLEQLPIEALAGVTSIDTRDFRLYCHQTLTGLKFLLIGTPGHSGLESIARQINIYYADYVLKNPFYKMDMLIRCDLFDQHLAKYIASRQ